MVRLYLVFSLLCLYGSLTAGETATTDISVEAQGLRIVKLPANGEDKLRAFNWFPGISVSLLISAPQGGLLEIDRHASKVTAFTDDKGKDLTKPEGEKQRFQRQTEFAMSSTISEDSKLCVTEVSAPGLPTKGATALTFKGEVTLVTATKKQDFTAESVELKAGTEISAGAIPLTIKESSKPKWGGDKYAWSVSLQAKQDLTSIAAIAFYDSAGALIESRRSSSSSSRFGDNVTITQSYQLKTQVDKAKIVITYWMDLQKVTVPVNLQVGLGI